MKPLFFNIVLACYMLLHSYTIFSQISPRDNPQDPNSAGFGFQLGNSSDSFLDSQNKVLPYENIEGSPYINNYADIKGNLPIGKLYSEHNKYVGTAFIRYNAYTDNMEVSVTDDGADFYHMIKKPDFFYIVFSKKRYRAYTNGTKTNYFAILSENDLNNCTLLMQEKILFKKEVPPESSFLSATPANFRRIKDSYFLKFKEKGIVAIPRKAKDFISVFPEHNALLKKYISDHKLKIKKQEDVLEIVNYYNTLVKK